MPDPETPPNPHAPWKLPVLGPLWLIQAVLALVFLVAVPYIATTVRYAPGVDVRTVFILIFTILNILLLLAEVVLFTQRRLTARTYLLAQWAKATLAGIVWVSLDVVFYSNWQRCTVGGFAIENFVLQHPPIIASLYYASRVYSKYGGGAGGSGVDGEGNAETERQPLLGGEVA